MYPNHPNHALLMWAIRHGLWTQRFDPTTAPRVVAMSGRPTPTLRRQAPHRKETKMKAEQDRLIDRTLGYGGIALAIVAVVVAIRAVGAGSSDRGEVGWMETAAAILGVAALACLVAITVRHLRIHGRGSGRSLLTAGWVAIPVISGLVLVFGGFVSGENRIGDWAADLVGSPQAFAMLLAVPLLLASAAILIDSLDEGAARAGRVTGTSGWYERRPR